jgi:hypothetical protein
MSYFDYGVRFQLLHRMNVAKPLDLMPYRKAEAMATLARELDWRYYGGKHYESRFTKFFQGWYLPTKWGYDKRLAHLSSLVVSGQMTRAAALEEFTNGALPSEEIEADKDYMANKLGISRPDFDELLRSPRRPHHAYACTPDWAKQMLRGVAGRAKRLLAG